MKTSTKKFPSSDKKAFALLDNLIKIMKTLQKKGDCLFKATDNKS